MTKTLRDKATGVGKMATETAGRATGAATRAGSTAQKTAETATPTSALQQSVQNLAGTLAERAVSKLSARVSNTAGRLTEYSDGGEGNLLAAVTGAEKLAGGASPLKAAVSGGVSKLGHSVREKFASVKESLTGGKGKGKGGKKLKLTNIVEYIDVGVPLELAYDQWTQFGDFPKFTKKLEQVEQVSDEKLSWTGKVFWSRRTWESTIVEQVPFERIVWRSKGAKGYIDGAVTFHELTPGLTRILVVLEYHPQGVFEKTANLWRAAGRRCRLELKQFQRQVMTDAVLHSDDIVGWHGEIHDGEVVVDDETARREEAEDSDDERAEEDSADEHAEEDSDDELAEEDSVEEEPDETEEDETDEHEPDRSESDTEEEPAPARRRPSARRKSTVTRRSRESREVSR